MGGRQSEDLLNRTVPPNPPDIETTYTEPPIDVTPSTMEEMRMVIWRCKRGRAVVPDNIPAEAFQSDIEVTASMLHVLYRRNVEEEQVPLSDWKGRYLIKILKEGDLIKCDKYTGITLHNNNNNNGVLLNQLKNSIDIRLWDQQFGFRKECCAQNKLRHYGWLLNNQFNGIWHQTSTLLTMRRRLTLCIEEHYENFFDTIVWV